MINMMMLMIDASALGWRARALEEPLHRGCAFLTDQPGQLHDYLSPRRIGANTTPAIEMTSRSSGASENSV
jgi:hypothetical protein